MANSYQSINNYIATPSSVLLLAPSQGPGEDGACVDLLTREPPGETDVLSVTLSESPSERLSTWQREAGDELPARAVIVDARREMTKAELPASEAGSVAVRGVPEHADLNDIGLAIASQLGAWKDTGETTVLCLHSVTTLLATYDAGRVISLITGLNHLCDRLDVVAHHHVDPDEHDAETMATLRPLYDAVIEYSPEGGWIPMESENATAAPTFRSTTPPPGGAAKTDPERPETVPMRYSFETILELLTDPCRRTVLYYLKDRPTNEISLDRLAEKVHEIDRSLPARNASPREEITIDLVHTHLPKLQAAGIVSYDPDSETIHYTQNRGLESMLRYVETIELG